jgi:hypothetical protein
MRRRLRWDDDRPGEPPLEHPYRDAALVYLGFAVVIVVVAVATGGNVPKALVIAALFWLVATAVSVVNLRRRRKLR